jgi:ankyrin repeat protein
MEARLAFGRAAALLALVCAALGADSGQDLLTAARTGDTGGVRDLLKSAVNLEAKGKDGKTALIWAAEGGHTDIVRLLVAKGADSQARDKEGLTAYDQALLSSEGKHEAILALLPKPARVRIEVDALWLPQNMIGSCFESRAELARSILAISPDALAVGALAEYARTAGKDAVEIVRANSEGLKADTSMITPMAAAADASATVVLAVRPGVSCSQQADHLSLAIDVRAIRAGGGQPVFKRTYGGGFTGLHEQTATNPAQYRAFYDGWAKGHASAIYWDVLRALLRQ